MGKSNYMERMRQYQKGSFKGMTTAERKDRYIKDVGEQAYNKAYDKAFEEDRNRTYGLFKRQYIPYRLTSESDKVAKPIALAARKSAVTKGSDRFDQVTRYDDMLGRATNPYKYQPGGMRMYGDPKLGDQTFSNIVYQESEAGKEEALKKQMEEAQADNTAMEEANAALQRQYSIGNRIEASGQTALQAGAKGLLKAADPLKGQTPNWTNAMIPNAAGETASLASGTAAAAATDATTDAATGALADATTNAATKGAGKLAKFASKYVNPAHAKAVSPYAIAGQIAGQGIKYLSDDDDATTMNFGEGAGGVISGAASGAGFGSILGPVGTAVGGVVGGLYGLGKGIYQRNKARNTIGAAEREKADELNTIGANMRREGVKSRSYSGYDFGRTLAKHGGVRLPGGTMNPIPGSDAVEFKGKSHKQGGILLDEQTEVEGGETMDKVTMKNEGPSDYFFSKYLKLGGRSYAQRHKDILKKGGTQQDINALAKSQEMAAGRNPGVVEMEKGGVRKYQGAGPRLDETGRLIDTRYPYLTNSMYQDIENFKPGYFNPPVYGPNRPPKAAQSAPVDISSVGNFYTPMNPALPDYQITMGVPELQIPGSGNQVDYLAGIKPRKQKAAQQREDVNLYSPNFYNPTEAQDDTKVAMNIGYVEGVPSFLETPRNIPYKPRPIDLGQEEETVNKVEDKATVTPTKATSKTTTSTSTPAVDDLPDLVYEDTQLEAIPEEAEAEAFLTKEQLDAKKAIEKKIQNNIPLTKEEEKALRNMYREAPALAMAAGAAQMIPAAYAFLRKEKAQKLMGPAGRIGAPKLERVDFNKERSQNASDARALSKSIETSGAGPAGIIAKMAAYGRKQTGDMQIAASESRANAGIQAQEAQMEQRADMMNIQNAMAVDNVNTQMMEAQRVANENRRYMALDAASQRASGLAGDYLSYKAQERLARTMGSMGIYERERLAKSLLGKINPRTSKLYTREDISKIYNINLDDPAIKEEGKKKEKE